MQIVSFVRTTALALAVTGIGFGSALAQSQAPAAVPDAHQAQPNAPYSGAGSGDAAAKQAPEGCQSAGGALKAQTPEQLAQGLQKQAPYKGAADDAAKNAMATCGGQ
jgi:hypothetical protein